MIIDKNIVKARFGKCLKTYDKHALVQREVAKELVARLSENCGIEYKSILEIGCGTGLLTNELIDSISCDVYCLNDVVEDVRHCISPYFDKANITSWKFIVADAEEMELPTTDLIVSASTFQWFENLPAFVAKVQKALNQDGILAFATYGEQNFKEIRDVTGSGLKYWGLDRIRMILQQEGMDVVHEQQGIRTLFFDTVSDILTHIKYTGVNGAPQKQWTVGDMKHFENAYESHRTKEGKLPLTYHPLIFIAKKR